MANPRFFPPRQKVPTISGSPMLDSSLPPRPCRTLTRGWRRFRRRRAGRSTRASPPLPVRQARRVAPPGQRISPATLRRRRRPGRPVARSRAHHGLGAARHRRGPGAAAGPPVGSALGLARGVAGRRRGAAGRGAGSCVCAGRECGAGPGGEVAPSWLIRVLKTGCYVWLVLGMTSGLDELVIPCVCACVYSG